MARKIDFSDEEAVLAEVAHALDIDPDDLKIKESPLASFGVDAYEIKISGGHKGYTVVESYDQMHELALAVVQQDLGAGAGDIQLELHRAAHQHGSATP